MKTKLQVFGTVLFVLSGAILATIYLAWLVFPVEISYLGLEKIVYMKSADISYNFNILMNYLTNPFQTVLDMPNFVKVICIIGCKIYKSTFSGFEQLFTFRWCKSKLFQVRMKLLLFFHILEHVFDAYRQIIITFTDTCQMV